MTGAAGEAGTATLARRGGLIELIAVLVVRYGIHVADNAGALPAALKPSPLVGLSWLYFLVAVALLAWRRHRGDSWAALGLAPPPGWLAAVGLAIAGAVAAIALDTATAPLRKALFGASMNLSKFETLAGNPANLALMLFVGWVFAAFGEEFFYRGWLMSRVTNLLGGGARARWAALFTQAALFGLAHLYQGWGGVVGTGTYALVYGFIVQRSRGNLAAAILGHGLIDTIGLTAIYAGAVPAA